MSLDKYQRPKKRSLPALRGPYSADLIRSEILKAAGLNLPELAQIVTESVAKLRSLMNAKETKFFTYLGDVSEREVEALGLQRQAAVDLLTLAVGAAASGGQTSHGSGPVVKKIIIRNFTVSLDNPVPLRLEPETVDAAVESLGEVAVDAVEDTLEGYVQPSIIEALPPPAPPTEGAAESDSPLLDVR